jgi:hypothetical protein
MVSSVRMDVGLAWLAINAVQAERTKAALAASAAGARLGNRHKLDHAGCLGRAALARAVDEFESSLIPVVQAIGLPARLTLASMAMELNRRGMRSARGGKWLRSFVADAG